MKNLKFIIKNKYQASIILGKIYSNECKTFKQNESIQTTYHSLPLLSLIKKLNAVLTVLIGITLVSLQTENERLCQPDKIYSVPPPLSVPTRVQQPHKIDTK